MIPVWWSVGLTVLGGLGWLLVTVERRLAGFLVGLAAQVAWISYAIVTAQWGFIGSALLFGAINALGLVRLRRAGRAPVTAVAAVGDLSGHRAFCWCRDRPGAHDDVASIDCPSDNCTGRIPLPEGFHESRCCRCGCTVRARMSTPPTPRS